MASKIHAYLHALAAHDAACSALGVDIWIGGEPTFTDRYSGDPQWNGGALGDDKRARAERVAAAIAEGRPGSVLIRPVGRQYPNEDVPRWCYGIYARRDGGAVWRGPPDPLLGGQSAELDTCVAVRDAIARARPGVTLDTDGALAFRLAVPARPDAHIDPVDPLLRRPPLDARATPEDGLRDELAERGVLLVCVGLEGGALRVDLPALPDAASYADWLEVVAGACDVAGAGGVIIGGFGPPADPAMWWTTVTPDPGVLEVNMAPEPGVAAFYDELRAVFAITREHGMSPYRLFFNGDASESGGGAHLTLGGPTPEASPWLREPRMLGRLLAYLNRHPSLSYVFAPDGVGSSGQFPRPDEVTAEALDELGVAVDTLARMPGATPDQLWAAFAPLLADRFGNTHRCEVNIEKLWNPNLPGRGKLGVVELRAMRMSAEPERAAAVAALFRALAAYAATQELSLELVDWGPALHDRFALPAFLAADLDAVLADLAAAGLALDDVLAGALRDDAALVVARVELEGATVTIKRAREFWPLIGDTSSEQQTSRLVDASCARLELSVCGDADAWTAVVAGHRVELARGPAGDERVLGVRYRRFVPTRGLHPHVGARDPLDIVLIHPSHDAAQILLHGWNPAGEPYDGLPDTPLEAARRRDERVVVSRIGRVDAGVYPSAPAAASKPYSVDTRRFER